MAQTVEIAHELELSVKINLQQFLLAQLGWALCI